MADAKKVAVEVDLEPTRQKFREFLSDLRRDSQQVTDKMTADLQAMMKKKTEAWKQSNKEGAADEEKVAGGQKSAMLLRQKRADQLLLVREQEQLERRLFDFRREKSTELYRREVEQQKKLYDEWAKTDRSKLDTEKRRLEELAVLNKKLLKEEIASGDPAQKMGAFKRHREAEERIKESQGALGAATGPGLASAVTPIATGLLRGLGITSAFLSIESLVQELVAVNREILTTQRDSMTMGGVSPGAGTGYAGTAAVLQQTRQQMATMGFERDKADQLMKRFSQSTRFGPAEMGEAALYVPLLARSKSMGISEEQSASFMERFSAEMARTPLQAATETARLREGVRGNNALPIGMAMEGAYDIYKAIRPVGGGLAGGTAALNKMSGAIGRGEISAPEVGAIMASMMSKFGMSSIKAADQLRNLEEAATGSVLTIKEMTDYTMDLANAQRKYGITVPEANETVKKWSNELKLGIVTVHDLAESQKRGPAGIQGTYMAGMLGMKGMGGFMSSIGAGSVPMAGQAMVDLLQTGKTPYTQNKSGDFEVTGFRTYKKSEFGQYQKDLKDRLHSSLNPNLF